MLDEMCPLQMDLILLPLGKSIVDSSRYFYCETWPWQSSCDLSLKARLVAKGYTQFRRMMANKNETLDHMVIEALMLCHEQTISKNLYGHINGFI